MEVADGGGQRVRCFIRVSVRDPRNSNTMLTPICSTVLRKPLLTVATIEPPTNNLLPPYQLPSSLRADAKRPQSRGIVGVLVKRKEVLGSEEAWSRRWDVIAGGGLE